MTRWVAKGSALQASINDQLGRFMDVTSLVLVTWEPCRIHPLASPVQQALPAAGGHPLVSATPTIFPENACEEFDGEERYPQIHSHRPHDALGTGARRHMTRGPEHSTGGASSRKGRHGGQYTRFVTIYVVCFQATIRCAGAIH